MLSVPQRQHGYAVLKEVILEITRDHNATTAQGNFSVQGEVARQVVFDGTAGCYFQIDHYDGKISVYWEEAGLESYKEEGLFGQMSTNFQELSKLPGGVLRVQGRAPEYSVHINYKS